MFQTKPAFIPKDQTRQVFFYLEGWAVAPERLFACLFEGVKTTSRQIIFRLLVFRKQEVHVLCVCIEPCHSRVFSLVDHSENDILPEAGVQAAASVFCRSSQGWRNQVGRMGLALPTFFWDPPLVNFEVCFKFKATQLVLGPLLK